MNGDNNSPSAPVVAPSRRNRRPHPRRHRPRRAPARRSLRLNRSRKFVISAASRATIFFAARLTAGEASSGTQRPTSVRVARSRDDHDPEMLASRRRSRCDGHVFATCRGKQRSRAVTFTEDAGTTLVHVRGEQTPTFTVQARTTQSCRHRYAASAAIRGAARPRRRDCADTEHVGRLDNRCAAARRWRNARDRVARAAGRYDVKTDGNEVVIMVMPRERCRRRRTRPSSRRRRRKPKPPSKKRRDCARSRPNRPPALIPQKTVEEAKKLSAKDLERAKQIATAAKDEAARAKTDAAKAQIEADRARIAAQASGAATPSMRRRRRPGRDAQARPPSAQASASKRKAEAAKARRRREGDAANAKDESKKTRAKPTVKRAPKTQQEARGRPDKA